MANVNVTYQEMQDQATKLASAKEDIENQLNSLKAQVDSLVGGGFVTDTASGQFQSSYEEFNTGAKECIKGLEGMGTYLTKAAQAFQDVDQQLASALKG
jgi:WXG100 family type VII secretion target